MVKAVRREQWRRMWERATCWGRGGGGWYERGRRRAGTDGGRDCGRGGELLARVSHVPIFLLACEPTPPPLAAGGPCMVGWRAVAAFFGAARLPAAPPPPRMMGREGARQRLVSPCRAARRHAGLSSANNRAQRAGVRAGQPATPPLRCPPLWALFCPYSEDQYSTVQYSRVLRRQVRHACHQRIVAAIDERAPAAASCPPVLTAQ